jgi:hypothetical protein
VRITFQKLAALCLFALLSLVASMLFFMACVPLADPLGGASGNLARENPPSFLLRLGMAAPFFAGSIAIFLLAAFVAKWALSKSRNSK